MTVRQAPGRPEWGRCAVLEGFGPPQGRPRHDQNENVMSPNPLDSSARWLRRAGNGYRKLPNVAQKIVLAAIALPMFALAGVGIGASLLGDDAPESPAQATASGTAAGGTTMLHGATGVLTHDLDQTLEEIGEAGPRVQGAPTYSPEYTARATALMQALPKDKDGNPDWAKVDMEEYTRQVAELGPPEEAQVPSGPVEFEALDLDEALELIAGKIDEASEIGDVLEAIRDSEQGDQPKMLISHSMVLMTAGDPWGAAANLLVAHEQDEDDATPLVNLAAIANSQNLPAVSLALLDAAAELDIGDDDSPVGMRERAALLNNRGHARVLLRDYAAAEAPLREALAMNPEMSEAARNLTHVLLKQGKDDEARQLVPRAVWRLRGNPAQPVPVQDRDQATTAPAQAPPTGTPEQIAQWVQSPFLERNDGSTSLPLWIALDLSKRGQIAWPEVLYPKADASYAGYFPQASANYVAAREAAEALQQAQAGPMRALVVRRMTLGEVIQQLIQVKATSQWSLEPIDTEMHPLKAWKENLILDAPFETRFQALDVAQAEYQMELAADTLNERYGKQSVCPAGSTPEECCAINRREIYRNINDMTPIAREYEDQMRVFFRDAYGLSTAIASNLSPGGWHDVARLGIEEQVMRHHVRVQQEIAFAFTHAAPSGGACYGPIGNPDGDVPELAVEVPACSAASQWGSGKWAFSENFSVEATCGKIKFVAEVNVIGTKKLKFGKGGELGADIGMHAEIEFSMEGTVTIFAGPKATAAGKIGEFGGDFGVKDGIYAVIGKDGVQDVGMRVVVGGGVAAGPLGGTHDVETMDFSFVSAL
jgi:tetratricopeptide (TPR) repeat protein